MSKGLEELKEIELKWQYGVFTFVPNFELIEKELKRLEELEKAFNSLSKEDEKTKKLLSLEIEKNRPLMIIKEKQVNVSALLELDNLEQYNGYCAVVGGCKYLAQEEYDLLKEVLS